MKLSITSSFQLEKLKFLWMDLAVNQMYVVYLALKKFHLLQVVSPDWPALWIVSNFRIIFHLEISTKLSPSTVHLTLVDIVAP